MARDDYEVGYGRPPKHTQFQKGNRANPRGRGASRKNLKTELMEELSARIPVTENGKRRLLSKQTVIVKRLVSDAAQGNPKARDQLIRLIGAFESVEPGAQSTDGPSSADAEILARFRARLVKEINAQGEPK